MQPPWFRLYKMGGQLFSLATLAPFNHQRSNRCCLLTHLHHPQSQSHVNCERHRPLPIQPQVLALPSSTYSHTNPLPAKSNSVVLSPTFAFYQIEICNVLMLYIILFLTSAQSGTYVHQFVTPPTQPQLLVPTNPT